MRRHYFDVFDFTPTVRPLPLDTEIGKLDASVHDWQLVRVSPVLDLLRGAIRAAVAVTSVPVSFLKERLVIPLEFVIEHDPFNAHAVCLKTLCGAQVRAIELRVVR